MLLLQAVSVGWAAAPVTVCVDPDWVPFERINEKGEHEGIAADLMQLVSKRAGIQFELIKTANWDESLAASRQGRCQVLSFLNDTPKRRQWLDFTEPLFTDANVFVTREEHAFISDPAYFSDEAIVFPVGTSMEERFRQNYPGLRVITVDNENEAFKRVSEKQADMTLRSLIVAAYTIKKDGWFNLKIAGELPNYKNELRMGVVKNEPELRERLNRGIRTITQQERWQIVNKHISIKVQTATDYSLLYKILLLFGLLALGGFYWNVQLKKHNRELLRVSQTDALTGLANRTRLNQVFLNELARARRYHSPFSIILLDLDDFKRVNDELGHIMGDKVLMEVARVSERTTRSSDTFGRWGGEEFLVLCPETPLQGAIELADRIRQALQMHQFASGRQQTVSVGVATMENEFDMDSLIHKADLSLAYAKQQGKNRVCSVDAAGASCCLSSGEQS
jgi:diguanylate cyclase (GGDEF)-like protein